MIHVNELLGSFFFLKCSSHYEGKQHPAYVCSDQRDYSILQSQKMNQIPRVATYTLILNEQRKLTVLSFVRRSLSHRTCL